MVESFEDLECYQFARRVRMRASGICKRFPTEERYRLVDQLIRSTRSATANIAEGHGRHHHTEHLPFLRHARGSLYESIEHYHTALDESFIDEATHREAVEEIRTTIKILNGYIRYIRSCVDK